MPRSLLTASAIRSCAGDYYVTLTQFDNKFSSGGNLITNPTFLRQNQPNYTTDL